MVLALSTSTRLGSHRMRTKLNPGGLLAPFSNPAGGSSNSNQPTKAWERGARLVKNTKVKNEYVEHIREIHDPSLHLKTIEDELMGTIGKALGKQGEKIMMYKRAMAQEEERHQELLENNPQTDHSPKISDSAKKHNQYRKEAIQARWELMVHRQAAGFLVNNHRFVMEKFPIGDPLPEDGIPSSSGVPETTTNKPEETAKKFGDQLDWWQRVGRWR